MAVSSTQQSGSLSPVSTRRRARTRAAFDGNGSSSIPRPASAARTRSTRFSRGRQHQDLGQGDRVDEKVLGGADGAGNQRRGWVVVHVPRYQYRDQDTGVWADHSGQSSRSFSR